jgi:hypothetical protein
MVFFMPRAPTLQIEAVTLQYVEGTTKSVLYIAGIENQ